MTNRIPDYLKLFIEETEEAAEKKCLPEFQRLWHIFPEVTGLKLRIAELESKQQLTFPWSDTPIVSYRVAIEPTKRSRLSSLTAARELEEALAELLNSLGETRAQLRRREAELAAAIPVVSVDADGRHLAERLQAVLRGTADMLQCFGAGLYLLDEGTTSLKLRSHHGLEEHALLKPPRPLEDAMADVEALAGNAVVIEDVKPSHWVVPEESQSAMCVPVSTANTILGTLWMFSSKVRDFTPQQQNLAEITAGRLAADLERSVLTQEVRTLRGRDGVVDADRVAQSRIQNGADSDVANDNERGGIPHNEIPHNEIERPRDDSAAWSAGRLTRFAPYIDGWDVADARTKPDIVGDFCHWHIVDDSRVHLAVGAAHGLTDKRLSSVSFQATHAAHTAHDPKPRELFELCNQSLWTSSIEGDASSLFHGVLDPTCGALQYAMCGGTFAWILRPHGWEPLLPSRSVLGIDCELKVDVQRQMLMPGDVLVCMTSAVCERTFERNNRMNQIAERLLRYTHLSGSELAELAGRQMEELGHPGESLAVMVAKRDES